MDNQCEGWEPCGCSNSHDGHCMICCKSPEEHGPEAVAAWAVERARRAAQDIEEAR